MSYGWTGTILRINLSNGTIEKEPTKKYSELFLGGKGINTKILWDEVGPEIKPLDPENRLIFGAGPVVGTLVPGSCRCSVVSKSPQTGIFGESNFGGYWGAELKFAGYDHIVIYGRCEEPMYLWINDKTVELKSARHLWGKNTIETQRIIKDELKNPDIQVACIGPGGENKVCIASINHGLGNSASRLGMGAVMGSKNLKAVAVWGTGNVKIARPDEFAKLCADIVIHPHPEMRMMYEDMMKMGTVPGIHTSNFLSYGNQEVTPPPEFSENYEKLLSEYYKKYLSRLEGCYNCPAPCKYLVTVPDSGQKIVIKCENNESMILRLKLCDYEFNVKSVALCYQYGLDLFSVSADIAYLMDLYEKGIITEKDTDGIPLKWKDGQAFLTMMEKIAKREGCGELFAEGLLKAAEKIGRGAEKYAYHTKKLEWINFSHYNLETALGDAVSETGSGLRTNSATLMTIMRSLSNVVPRSALDMLIKMNFPKHLQMAVINKDASEGKADLLHHQERVTTQIPDLLGICKFLSGWLPFHFFYYDEMVKFLALVIGKDINGEMLDTYSERIINLTRSYNVREGITRKDDSVPEILFSEPSPITGEPLNRKEFDEQLDRYYQLHGWDMNGVPTRKQLEDIGLKDVADELGKREIIKEKVN